MTSPRTTARFDGQDCVRRAIGAEIIAALLWGPKELSELAEIVGVHPNTVSGWVRAYRDSGVVVAAGERITATKPATLWAVAAKPFGEPRP